jgi:hypothetical protein
MAEMPRSLRNGGHELATEIFIAWVGGKQQLVETSRTTR